MQEDEWRFKTLSAPTEWVESYFPGGLHPVKVGDCFDGDKYLVLRKLGYGAFSAVWLAQDKTHNRYVALKIATAHSNPTFDQLKILQQLSEVRDGGRTSTAANHVVDLLDHFLIHGPNGVHQCLVFEPMAATANSLLDVIVKRPAQQRYPLWLGKRLAKHVLLGLHFLHSNKIAHSDLQPGNILFLSDKLQRIEMNVLKQTDGRGSTSEPVQRKDGKLDLWAPPVLYLNQPLLEYVDISPSIIAKLSDLGSAFTFDNPPKTCVTPMALRAPELVLDQAFDHRIDIWSFGCLLYEFIAGTPLFVVCSWTETAEHEANDDHLLQLVDTLGHMPPSLFNCWDRRERYFAPDLKWIRTDVSDAEFADPKDMFFGPSLEQAFEQNKPHDLGDEEARQILEILRKTLSYDKKNRPSTEDLLQEDWFRI